MAKAKAEKEVKSTLSDLDAQLRKAYGDIMISSKGLEDRDLQVISVTPSLDNGLGGGIAMGCVTTLASRPGGGKTTLALTIAAAAQAQYKSKCYFIDAEGRMRASLLHTIPGLVWTDKQAEETGIPALTIIRSSTEKILSAQDYVNIIVQIFKDTKPGELGPVVILDSIAVLCTEAQMAIEVGEASQMMEVSKLLYTFFRQVNPILSVQGGSLICLTHLQASASPYKPSTAYGGNAPEYFSSNYLISYSAEVVKDKDGKEIGKNTKFKVKKAAMGGDGKEIFIYIRPGRGCDIEEDLVTTAVELAVVEKGGSWFTYNGEKYQGQDALTSALRADPELRQKMWDEVTELLK